MTSSEIALIYVLLAMSVGFFVLPVLIYVIRRRGTKASEGKYASSGISKMVLFSACLIGAIWCLRYAVGYYTINSIDSTEPTLTWWEEIFNSMAHTLQTFSMDEEYTEYIINGKIMLRDIMGGDTSWQLVYGLYVSVLNFIAPVAGGAIIFEILASIFPKIRLQLSYLAFWKEKYYFSKLNDSSLTLAKSVYRIAKSRFRRPVIIFTDVFVDDENEKGSEMLLEAKRLGTICVREDLSHVAKNKFGMRKLFLIDEEETENLKMLSKLSNEHNHMYLKKAEIFLFVHGDAYIQVEGRIRDKLLDELKFSEDELPVFIPIQSDRNLISNLLVDIPLYEPLINKDRKEDGTVDLAVTILGTGDIGTEMFLSSYWFGQMLNCNYTINVISQESEEEFWDKIDYINPEIRHTTIEGDPILKINRRGDYAMPYCKVNYVQGDVRSSAFVKHLSGCSEYRYLLDTDYFFVALGSDEENISAANTVRKYVGQYHIALCADKRTVITYVVCDSELADTLNRTKKYNFVNNRTDVYMCAVGSLRDVFSVRNVFMTEYELLAQKTHEAYLSVQNREQRADAHGERLNDDYKHWANLARGMHMKYKMFSMGLFSTSIFDVESADDLAYIQSIQEAYEKYKKTVTGDVEFKSDREIEDHMALMHKLAWLEHRRWNAFTRVKGFRHTDNYDVYAVPGKTGSYKQMDIKLHPCLVECDQRGIRAAMDQRCVVEKSTVFQCTDKSQFDLLDEVSYDLYEKGYNDYDVKQYDYPISDFEGK